MKRIKFTLDAKTNCPFCQEEVNLIYEEISNRWRNPSIPDEDLDDLEMIDRVNNEAPDLVTCPKCGKSLKEL